MTTSEMTTVERAIEESIRETSIVTLEARVDTSEWASLIDALTTLCEDTVRQHQPDEDTTVLDEFWGTDDDGDQWRVHVMARA